MTNFDPVWNRNALFHRLFVLSSRHLSREMTVAVKSVIVAVLMAMKLFIYSIGKVTGVRVEWRVELEPLQERCST